MQDLDMNTRKAMSEAIAVLDAPGSQGVGRTMYLKTRWTKVEEPSRSGRLLSRAGGQDTCTRVYLQILSAPVLKHGRVNSTMSHPPFLAYDKGTQRECLI